MKNFNREYFRIQYHYLNPFQLIESIFMKKLPVLFCILIVCFQCVGNAQSSVMSIAPLHKSVNRTTDVLPRYELSLLTDVGKNKTAVSPQNTITTSTVAPFNYCKGAAVSVPFTIVGTFNGDNVFTAQLSDNTGSFTSPTTIGTLTATTAGTIDATIPVTVSQGSGYRIRVIGNSPATTGTDNGTNLAVNPLPTVYSITGNSSYCSGGAGVIIGLSGSEVGVNYQLQRDGANIGSTIGGNFLPITFGGHTVVGTYTVVATFVATGCTQLMDGSIALTINPLPLQYNVTGGGSFCSGGAGMAVGLSNTQVGVNYQLLRYAAEVGAHIGGTGEPISFGSQTVEGLYSVIAKNPATGCTQDMTGVVKVTINPLPTQYNVVGGGSFCEGDKGVQVILYSSDTNIIYQLKVDGTPTGTAKTGTGLAIEFGLQKQPGVYTVEATNVNTGCKSTMLGSTTVVRNPIPAKPKITKTGNELSSSESTGNQWYLNKQLIVGATSKTYSPSTSGGYSVVVTLKSCSSEMSDVLDVTVNSDKLVAGFNADVTTGDAPLVVNFTDASTGKPTSWNWNFGDTQTSTEQKPVHTYTKSGSYTVTLTVSDGTATDVKTKEAFIVVQESVGVTPDFKAASTGGQAPFVVQFTDMSSGSPSEWEWDFGDGTAFSTIQNPEHTYTNAGSYTVVLTVTKDSKQYKTTKKDFITVDTASVSVDENIANDSYNNRMFFTPNPTNGASTLYYYSLNSQKVVLTVNSILGEQIIRKEIEMQSGENTVPLGLQGADLSTGIYYVVIQHSSGTFTRILQIVR